MKREKALHILSHDHHHGLRLAQLIKKGALQYKNLPNSIEGKVEYTINFYASELKSHFIKEEDILFKMVKGRNSEVDELIKLIISEHEKISELVASLINNSNKEDLLNELGILLDNHIRKEERDLFMKIQNLLTGEELKEVSDKMENL